MPVMAAQPPVPGWIEKASSTHMVWPRRSAVTWSQRVGRSFGEPAPDRGHAASPNSSTPQEDGPGPKQRPTGKWTPP